MILKYVNKNRAKISIFSSKKTKNLLDGTYQSVYKGKSLNFENLRDYDLNDDIKDIDWKSSTRSASLLVKQYIAEKKYNVMFVIDSGLKMSGSTLDGSIKKDIALYSAGTLAYITISNGDYMGMIFNTKGKVKFYPFKLNLYSLENYLNEYDKNSCLENNLTVNDLLKYTYRNIKKNMIIFVITDNKGLSSIEPKTLKELAMLHETMFINIEDAYMFGDNVFDIDDDRYVPSALSHDKELLKYEQDLRNNMFKKYSTLIRKNKMSIVSIKGMNEINDKIVELLESYRYGNNR